MGEKILIVKKTLDERTSIWVVTSHNGVGANLLYRWRRRMLEGALA